MAASVSGFVDAHREDSLANEAEAKAAAPSLPQRVAPSGEASRGRAGVGGFQQTAEGGHGEAGGGPQKHLCTANGRLLNERPCELLRFRSFESYPTAALEPRRRRRGIFLTLALLAARVVSSPAGGPEKGPLHVNALEARTDLLQPSDKHYARRNLDTHFREEVSGAAPQLASSVGGGGGEAEIGLRLQQKIRSCGAHGG